MSDWRRLRAEEWRPRLAARSVPAELLPPLAQYLVLLGRFEPAVDLVGRVGPETLIDDHVVDSLAAAPLLPASGVVLDVGSGNGFPAIPLLLARRSLRGVLLEPRERRWAFLKTTVRELGLDADVRRERLDRHNGGGYDAMTVRALGVEAWSGLAAGVLREGGVALWWTTPGAAAAAAPPGMVRVVDSALPAPGRGVIAAWRRCST